MKAMFYRSSHLLVLVTSILLIACSDPRSTALPDDIAKLETIKPQVEKLSEADRGLLTGFLMRRSMSKLMPGLAKTAGDKTAGTIGEAIDSQKKYVEEAGKRDAAEKLAAAKIKQEHDAAVASMRDLVSVGLISKKINSQTGYSGIETERTIEVSFNFTNKSAKDIAGVKGRITARDQFGDELSGFQISNDETIKTGGAAIWRGSRSVKYAFGGNNKDEKFVETEDGKYSITWEPQAIVFTDGTKVIAP